MKTYTVFGLCNNTTLAVEVAGVVLGKHKNRSARTHSGALHQWVRFARTVSAAGPTEAEDKAVRQLRDMFTQQSNKS
ncbi:hypothetical protein [Saccharopolyspora hattusasensis]|uniref:hypothetical protein n=1 Tax=Saccharopolyspora hattusasensis TaxID=1128679 RepID=UPI003D997077